mmetsp:Transcript_41482/g.101238  ORF Transcript_41482/g.101238 Transcript_41482/m.101238 type:complete len:233 (-) Transcript_41482:395-1093(-)
MPGSSGGCRTRLVSQHGSSRLRAPTRRPARRSPRRARSRSPREPPTQSGHTPPSARCPGIPYAPRTPTSLSARPRARPVGTRGRPLRAAFAAAAPTRCRPCARSLPCTPAGRRRSATLCAGCLVPCSGNCRGTGAPPRRIRAAGPRCLPHVATARAPAPPDRPPTSSEGSTTAARAPRCPPTVPPAPRGPPCLLVVAEGKEGGLGLCLGMPGWRGGSGSPSRRGASRGGELP